MNKNKVLFINSAFTKELPAADDKIDSIFIEGYASTNDTDRGGDVVPVSVWEAGMKNYLKNPIILSQHDHDDPIGRMTEHKIDGKGLWIKARISAAAEVFNLVKDEVLTAFSIGFRVLDAEYNAAAELFVIKELELIEISVVSIPCNQNTLFNLSKAFENEEDYSKYKAQFAPKGESAKGLESPVGNKSTTTSKEWNMDPKELAQMIADASKVAAESATKALLDAQAKQKAEADAIVTAAAEFDTRVKAAVAAQVSVGESGAERLMKDLEKRFVDQTAESAKAIAGMQSALTEKAAEIAAMQKSKMQFSDAKGGSEYAEREKAFLLSKITGKSIDGTKFGQDLVTKYAGSGVSPQTASATWELEVSTNMEAEVRRRLIIAPLVRSINMQTNVMTMPLNPEAGAATWITNAQFGTTASPGAAQVHALKEITLNAYKVATMEYLAYETEEDSLIVLLPIIRDAMIRRVARAMDKAYLMGAGAGGDPVKGLSIYDATSVVVPTNTGAASVANLRALRKDLGAWGLDPAEVTYVVSTEVYYDLLDDTLFQTMQNVGTQATLLTGQVGSIGNSPVLVSSEFPTKAGGAATAATNIGALAFASANFMAGNQRGLRFDTQDLVESQRKVLVASLRTGLVQTTTNLGQGVSTLRWS
jgi:HK97 family phage prohead protease/HK97 family phage major capsid protein